MKPVEFDEANVLFGENQPQYMPLPALVLNGGEVITCWELSQEEMKTIFATGRIWMSMLTFNKPLQPVKLSVDKLFVECVDIDRSK